MIDFIEILFSFLFRSNFNLLKIGGDQCWKTEPSCMRKVRFIAKSETNDTNYHTWILKRKCFCVGTFVLNIEQSFSCP